MSNPNEDKFLKFLADAAKRRAEALVEEKGLEPPPPKSSTYQNPEPDPGQGAE